jgi:hypothetical protein
MNLVRSGVMSRPALFPRPLNRRPLWVALLGLVVLLGVLDFHPAGERHSLLELPGTSGYSPEAAHSEQPIHLEPGKVVQRPHCPICLQRLQLSGLHPAATVELAPPAVQDLRLEAADRAPAGGTLCSSGARAPPLS